MSERKYEKELKARIRARFPGCVIMKNDPAQLQGVPDILILYQNTWAMLEVKLEDNSPKQPNQPYYIQKFGAMSFASFINPDTEEAVLDELQSAFESSRQARVS